MFLFVGEVPSFGTIGGECPNIKNLVIGSLVGDWHMLEYCGYVVEECLKFG